MCVINDKCSDGPIKFKIKQFEREMMLCIYRNYICKRNYILTLFIFAVQMHETQCELQIKLFNVQILTYFLK